MLRVNEWLQITLLCLRFADEEEAWSPGDGGEMVEALNPALARQGSVRSRAAFFSEVRGRVERGALWVL